MNERPHPGVLSSFMRLLFGALVLALAAVCEVTGDAMIRSGLRGRGVLFVALGVAVLGAYGVVVNLLPLDFSRLLGTYVAFFAVASVLFGRLVFRENVPTATWVGLFVIVAGSAILQLGQAR